MIYFWSDLHLGHTNIIRYCSRPFNNPEEMSSHMAVQYKNTVRSEDTVYWLGDIAFNKTGSDYAREFLFTGKNHCIIGNHDRHFNNGQKIDETAPLNEKLFVNTSFDSFHDTLEIEYAGKKIILSHIPLRNEGKYDFNFHGHLHGNVDAGRFNECSDYYDIRFHLDVSVDNEYVNFCPLDIDSCMKIMEQRNGR